MIRARAIELGVASLLAIAAGTELLSICGLVGRASSIVLWLLIAALWAWGLRGQIPKLAPGLLLPVGATVSIWVIEGIIAIASPPNSSDAMAYHMPRILYWIQQHSVANFATPYLNQIMLQPLAEYVTMHFYLLAGSDQLANCGTWLATGGYIVGASVVAMRLGASARAQAWAAFLAATLPNGILQASGAKNEALLAFLLCAMTAFALDKRHWPCAAACGLACLTKGTSFLFAGPLVLLLLPRAALHCALAVCLINAPFFARNIELSGSPLGFDSAQGDGVFRWRNETFGLPATASNLMRHAGEQVAARSERWNQGVYQAVLSSHAALGIDADNRGTTWPNEHYTAPRNSNHETDANNRWHLLLVAASAAWCWRNREASRMLLALGLGLLLFCAYLKWQPFMLRMFLPLYALAMAAASLGVARLPALLQVAVMIFLIDGCRLPLFKAWVRPLVGPGSVLVQPREQQYFSDMTVWHVKDKYFAAIDELRRLPCRDIGMDIEKFQLEYPLQAILLKQDPAYRFVHVGTTNASKMYEGRTSNVRPCVIVCLACDRWVKP